MEITKERLRCLEDIEMKMEALEAGGIDNWEWYGESLEEYNKTIEQRDSLQKLYNEIEEAFSEGIKEPAGTGAGYGVSEEASENAFYIFTKGVEKLLEGRNGN